MLQTKFKQCIALSIVLCLLMSLAPVSAFASGEGQIECEHAETSTSIMESTCVKKGTKQTICKTCGEVVSEEELPLSDEHVFYNGACLLCKIAEPVGCEHEYETVKEEAPTCMEAGYVWTKCTKCGDEKNYEVGEPTGKHSDETYVDIFESTCVKKGSKKICCKVCDEVLSEEELPLSDEHAFHNDVCLLCGADAPCEHEYETVKELAPTCKEAGYVWTKCTKCGNEKNYEVGEPLGEHSDETYVDIFESTCVKKGSKKICCKVCDEVLSEEELPLSDEHAFHNGICLLCGAEEVIPCEHDYVIVKELAPTCKEAGYVWTECSKCGNEKNYEVGEPTGEHSDETYVDIFESTCVKNGYKKVCCKVCDEALSEEELPLSDEHAFHNGACLLCGAEEVIPCEHDYQTVKEDAPTCKEAGYVWTKCTKCGDEKNYEVGEPTGEHNYDNACDANCNVCDEARAVDEHIYDDEYDADCNECGDTREVAEKPDDPYIPSFPEHSETNHHWSAWITYAMPTSCGENGAGLMKRTCACGASETKPYTLDHDIEHVEAKDATATEDGNVEYWACAVCEGVWADEALTEATTLDAVVIPAAGETEPEETTPVTPPETTEPEVPEVTEPEITEPEVPEVTEPEITEPEVTEPEATESAPEETTEAPADTEAPTDTTPEATEPETTEPETTEPEVVEPEETTGAPTEPEVPEQTEAPSETDAPATEAPEDTTPDNPATGDTAIFAIAGMIVVAIAACAVAMLTIKKRD